MSCPTVRRPRIIGKVRGAGLEPASPGSKPGSLPLADPRECPAGIEPASPGWKPGTSAARPRAQSCGGRNRTCVGAINSRLPVPARVPPQCQSARLESNQHFRAPEARGLTISPTRRRMSAQRESNPLFRPGKAAGCRYIMGALCHNQIVNEREHRAGLEPASPHYGCGVLAARRPVLVVSRTRGTRTLTYPVKSRECCR